MLAFSKRVLALLSLMCDVGDADGNVDCRQTNMS